MALEIVRKQTPEEEELLRKREELASVRAALAERELELADFRAQLKSFEGRYLRQVGVLYAEMDDLDARVAELEYGARGVHNEGGVAAVGGVRPAKGNCAAIGAVYG